MGGGFDSRVLVLNIRGMGNRGGIFKWVSKLGKWNVLCLYKIYFEGGWNDIYLIFIVC